MKKQLFTETWFSALVFTSVLTVLALTFLFTGDQASSASSNFSGGGIVLVGLGVIIIGLSYFLFLNLVRKNAEAGHKITSLDTAPQVVLWIVHIVGSVIVVATLNAIGYNFGM